MRSWIHRHSRDVIISLQTCVKFHAPWNKPKDMHRWMRQRKETEVFDADELGAAARVVSLETSALLNTSVGGRDGVCHCERAAQTSSASNQRLQFSQLGGKSS